MKVLLLALLLLPLISARTAHDYAIGSLKSFLNDGTWINLRGEFHCNHNSIYNGGFDPDHGIWEQMKKLDPENLSISRVMFIGDNRDLILFFLPAVSRWFTAKIKITFILIVEYELTNYQYYCPALGIAQTIHKELAIFGQKQMGRGFKESRLLACEKEWEPSHLHNPMIYEEIGQPERLIMRENCTEGNGDFMMERAKDDQILGANFVDGSDFKKIKYTAVTWHRKYTKYGLITEFTLEEIGSRYEYVHMKDLKKFT